MREGLRFIGRDRLLLALTLTSAANSFIGPVFINVVLAIYAKEQYGSALALGLLRGGWGAGALIGTLIFAAIAHRLPRRRTFALALILCGVFVALLCLALPLAVSVLALVASAAVNSPTLPLRMTIQQTRTPMALRSRVFGTMNAVMFLAVPFGTLVFTNLVTTHGAVATIAAMDGVFLCVGLTVWFLPVFRLMDAPIVTLATMSPATARAALAD